MKKQIRRGVFETNSSSTHSICISKEDVKNLNLPNSIHFHIGEFGWRCEEVSPADYLYTIILEREDHEKCIDRLETLLGEEGIKCYFETAIFDEDGYLCTGYVDHANEIYYLVDNVLNDKDKLLRYLFSNNTCVFTGNDNCDASEENGCYKKCKAYWDKIDDWENNKTYPNPDYDENKFEYFYKGNHEL